MVEELQSNQRPASLATAFTRQFAIDFPIVCAPMFLVSNVEMTVASAESGALGTFPALNFRPIENYRKAIQKIKEKTAKPFGINIITQKVNKFQDQQIDIALEEKVPLIITSLGSPRQVIKRAKEVDTKVYCDVIGMEHAKKVADYGVDGLVAVSCGAGGHAGTTSPFALIPYLSSEINLPILAAGSITDGRGMLAAFALGASGIYMGTRFIASNESPSLDAYKEAIVKAVSEDIVNTDKVDGFPGNFIKNKALENIGLDSNLLEEVANHSKRLKRWIAMARAARSLVASDNSKISYETIFSAGHGVSLIHEIKPIENIVYDTINHYRSLTQKLPS